jgi:hypothetical protein
VLVDVVVVASSMEELAVEKSELLDVDSEGIIGSPMELEVVVNVVSDSLLEEDVAGSLVIRLLEELSVTSESLLEEDVVTSLEARLLEEDVVTSLEARLLAEDVVTSLEARLLEELSVVPLSELNVLDEVAMIGSIATSVVMVLDLVIVSLLLDEDISVELAGPDVTGLSVVDDDVAEGVSSVKEELVEASKLDDVVEDMSSVNDDVVEASTVDNVVEDVSSVEDELVEASLDDDVVEDVSSMTEELVEVSLMELEDEISTVVELMLESAVMDVAEDETELLQAGVKVVVVEVTGRHEHALVMDGPGAWSICRLSR